MVFARYVIWVASLLLTAYNTQAEETDQFTLPPNELVDIGPTVSNRVYDILEKAIAQTNFEIQALFPKAQKSRSAAYQLARRQSDRYIIHLIYKQTGVGLPEATLERWLHWHAFSKKLKPMRFNPFWPWKSVYWLVFSQCPGALIFLSPTINMYGYYFGTDKIGHFFQQGKGYYDVYMNYLAKGQSIEQARAVMIAHGQRQEDTIFGTLLNGVYSNADLAANYAGWKFYMNVAHPVRIGERTLPPLLVLKNGQWVFARNIDKNTLLAPYINDALNEAWNPNHYFFMRSIIRSNIKKRCGDWIQRVGLTSDIVQAKLNETRRWAGEDYGHWLPKQDALTLELCFHRH